MLATDIDTKVLEKAVKGVYSKSSVEQLPNQYVRRYFKQINGDEYCVKDELRKEVLFRQLNLMNPLSETLVLLSFEKPSIHLICV